jgi:hypothetical protein
VSELCHIPPETLGQPRHLQAYIEAQRCCGKSLIRSALVGFGVRQHARRESISKRAPSTTRTSLRFRINDLQAVGDQNNAKPPFTHIQSHISRLSKGLPTRRRLRREEL